MLKRRISMLMFVMTLGLVLSACGSSDESSSSEGTEGGDEKQEKEQITLTFADYMPDTHFSVINQKKPLIEKIEELTEGQVKIDYYPGEQLGKAGDMLSLVQTGGADMAYVSQAYISGDMQLSSFASLPGLMEDQVQGSKAMFDVVTSSPVLEKDYLENGVRPLMATASTPYEFWTVDKQIKTVDDIKGLKIRISGGAAKLHVESLGGVPTSISAPEQYQALEKGTIDGTLFTITSVPSYHLNEVVNYATLGAGGGPNLGLIFINEEKWQSLPSEIQEKITQAVEEVLDEYLVVAEEEAQSIIDENKESGDIEFYEVDKAEFSKAAEGVVKEWIEDNEAKGLPAQETIDLYKKALEKHKQ